MIIIKYFLLDNPFILICLIRLIFFLLLIDIDLFYTYDIPGWWENILHMMPNGPSGSGNNPGGGYPWPWGNAPGPSGGPSGGPGGGPPGPGRGLGEVSAETSPPVSPQNGPPEAPEVFFGNGFVFHPERGYFILDPEHIGQRGFLTPDGQMHRHYGSYPRHLANALDHAAIYRPVKTAAFSTYPWDFELKDTLFMQEARKFNQPYTHGVAHNDPNLRLFLRNIR
jgi:hypothetical protein